MSVPSWSPPCTGVRDRRIHKCSRTGGGGGGRSRAVRVRTDPARHRAAEESARRAARDRRHRRPPRAGHRPRPGTPGGEGQEPRGQGLPATARGERVRHLGAGVRGGRAGRRPEPSPRSCPTRSCRRRPATPRSRRSPLPARSRTWSAPATRPSRCWSPRHCRSRTPPSGPPDRRTGNGPASRSRSWRTASTSNNPDFIRAGRHTSSPTTRTSPATVRTRRPPAPRPSATRAPSRRRVG